MPDLKFSRKKKWGTVFLVLFLDEETKLKIPSEIDPPLKWNSKKVITSRYTCHRLGNRSFSCTLVFFWWRPAAWNQQTSARWIGNKKWKLVDLFFWKWRNVHVLLSIYSNLNKVNFILILSRVSPDFLKKLTLSKYFHLDRIWIKLG